MAPLATTFLAVDDSADVPRARQNVFSHFRSEETPMAQGSEPE